MPEPSSSQLPEWLLLVGLGWLWCRLLEPALEKWSLDLDQSVQDCGRQQDRRRLAFSQARRQRQLTEMSRRLQRQLDRIERRLHRLRQQNSRDGRRIQYLQNRSHGWSLTTAGRHRHLIRLCGDRRRWRRHWLRQLQQLRRQLVEDRTRLQEQRQAVWKLRMQQMVQDEQDEADRLSQQMSEVEDAGSLSRPAQ